MQLQQQAADTPQILASREALLKAHAAGRVEAALDLAYLLGEVAHHRLAVALRRDEHGVLDAHRRRLGGVAAGAKWRRGARARGGRKDARARENWKKRSAL